MKLLKHFKLLYIDAFVASSQCSQLEFIEKQDVHEQLILQCYKHWVKNSKTFKLLPDTLENYQYRNIQKDSMRCYLLYITVQIKQYICKVSPENLNVEEVSTFLIKKLKLLKFGAKMLTANDYHIQQLNLNLQTIFNNIQPILD